MIEDSPPRAPPDVDHRLEALRCHLVDALRAAIAGLDPAVLVARALPARPPKNARVAVLAVGKAALAMARGALARWSAEPIDALIVTVDGVAFADPAAGGGPPITFLHAGHPLPDLRSVAAAERALTRARSLADRDICLALISGGASALLAAPPPGVTLTDKRALVAELLDAGAPISEVNLIRRHLSRVKGGRILAAAGASRVLTYIVSDVIGGAAHDIGSGPTVFDPTTVDDARAALARWAPSRLAALAPRLDESQKPAFPLRARWQILADPDALAQALADEIARRTGMRARAAPGDQGSATSIVARRLALARELAPGEAIVIPCEPTLALPAARGRGGRAGFIALAAMRDLPADVALLCGASDGVDGSSGTAGAAVTRAAAARLDDASLDAAIAAFDDAGVHERIGTAIAGGPTGNNLTDVHVLARLG